MEKWYVGTLSRYVIVEAANEEDARQKGQALLPTRVRTVREPTQPELELTAWDEEQNAREAEAE